MSYFSAFRIKYVQLFLINCRICSEIINGFVRIDGNVEVPGSLEQKVLMISIRLHLTMISHLFTELQLLIGNIGCKILKFIIMSDIVLVLAGLIEIECS